MAVAALVPFFRPGFGRFGFQFFDVVNMSDSTVHLIQITGWMMAASGVMGIARLPPNTPASRSAIFIFCTWVNIMCSALLSSNFNYHPTAWLYDGFKFPGNVFLIGIGLAGQIPLLQIMDNAIAGSNKGRESNNLATTRVSAFMLALTFLSLWFITSQTFVPYLTGSSTKSVALLKETVLVLDQKGMNAFMVWAHFSVIMQAALGSLFNTLQFEKKISPKIGAVFGLISLVLFNFDATLPLRMPSILPTLSSSLSEVFSSFPLFTFMYWGITLAAIMNAFRRKFGDEAALVK